MAKASQGASFTFILATAFASYFAMHPVLLFPPLMVLLYDAKTLKKTTAPHVASFVVTHTIGFAGAIGALLTGSAFLMGSWDFLSATYGVRLLLPDLTPNVGLWWYFFIEMFDSFREFFLGVFWLHAASYMPGLTIRLHKQPLFVACTLTGVFAIFTPYPSIADAALYLSLVPMFRHLFPRECFSFQDIVTKLTVLQSCVIPSWLQRVSYTHRSWAPPSTIFGSMLDRVTPTSSTLSHWSGVWDCPLFWETRYMQH